MILAAACALACATAVQTDTDAVELTVRVQAKRPLERHVYAEACGLPSGVLFCDSGEQTKRVHLRRGRNVVRFQVRRLVYRFVGVDVTGIPWDGYRLQPEPVESVWWRLGDHGRAREVVPSAVAHDTLRDAGA
jgi:hypothetical protein